MADTNTSPNLLQPEISLEEKQQIFAEFDFSRFNGVRREVKFDGSVVRVEHGLPFTPDPTQLDLIFPWKKGDVGTVYLADKEPDSQYVYLKASGKGSASVRILHPTKRGT
jgi:hypothetical protein